MKVLRIVVVSVLMMLVACACERLESSQVEMGFFFGAWQEYYGPDYHVEVLIRNRKSSSIIPWNRIRGDIWSLSIFRKSRKQKINPSVSSN